MLVEDLIRVLPMDEKLNILNAGKKVYSGVAFSIPEYLLDYETKTIWTHPMDDCIYISIC